jgi:hypothetical protein
LIVGIMRLFISTSGIIKLGMTTIGIITLSIMSWRQPRTS